MSTSLSSPEVVQVGFVGDTICVDGLGQGVGGPGLLAVFVVGCPVGVLDGLFLHTVVLAAVVPGPQWAVLGDQGGVSVNETIWSPVRSTIFPSLYLQVNKKSYYIKYNQSSIFGGDRDLPLVPLPLFLGAPCLMRPLLNRKCRVELLGVADCGGGTSSASGCTPWNGDCGAAAPSSDGSCSWLSSGSSSESSRCPELRCAVGCGF